MYLLRTVFMQSLSNLSALPRLKNKILYEGLGRQSIPGKYCDINVSIPGNIVISTYI